MLAILIIGLVLIITFIAIFIFIDFKKREVKHHKKTKHYVVIKKKEKKRKKVKVIELSSKETSQNKKNIKLSKNPDKTNPEPSYVIPVVRNRNLDDIEKSKKPMYISHKDLKITDEIYNDHLKNIEELENGRKKKKK